MKRVNKNQEAFKELRQRAEELARNAGGAENAAASDDIRRLLHELDVHQIELELQNEELRRAQVELEDSRQRYRELFDFAPIGYFLLGAQGVVRQVNLKGAEMLGTPRSTLVKRKFQNFVDINDMPLFLRHLDLVWNSRVAQSCQVRLRPRKDRPALQVMIQSVRMEDTEAKHPAIRSTVADITELKVAEGTLREADRRKDEFLAMLAHELRNPLAPIRNAVQVLRAAGDREPLLSRQQDIIDRQVSHMARLLEDLLDASRVTRGKITLQRAHLDLRDPVAEMVQNCRETFERRGQRLTLKMSEAPVWVRGDPVRLAQIAANLLNNAGKYTEAGGEIQVTLTAEHLAGEGEYGVLKVRDNGMGIDAELLPRIFDMFIQADRSLDRAQGGLGIGLTLVRSLVELHGGCVGARSEGVGKGSEFSVYLPLAAAPAESVERAEKVVKTVAPGEEDALMAGLKVLVVEDVVDTANTLAELLQIWGCQPAVALDGSQALIMAAADPPTVVLLDIGLPGMNGFETARRLREDVGLRSATIVALTGYGRDEDTQMSREAGFDLHLTKPVDMKTLREVLGQAGLGARGEG